MDEHDETRATTNDSDLMLRGREKTLIVLQAAHAHILWPPCLVDVCLNHFPNVDSIDEIMRSPRFVEACDRADQAFKNRDVLEAARCAGDALTNPACPLLERYLRRQVGRVLKMLCLSEGYRDVVSDTVRDEFFRLIPDYRVGSLGDDGTLRTWGYEAFISTRLPGRTCAKLHKVLRELSTRDVEMSQIADDPRVEANDVELRPPLRAALQRVLHDSLRRDAYCRLIYGGFDGKTVAAQTGCRPADIHRRIVQPLIIELRQALGAVNGPRFRFGKTTRRDLAALIPHDEFKQLFST